MDFFSSVARDHFLLGLFCHSHIHTQSKTPSACNVKPWEMLNWKEHNNNYFRLLLYPHIVEKQILGFQWWLWPHLHVLPIFPWVLFKLETFYIKICLFLIYFCPLNFIHKKYPQWHGFHLNLNSLFHCPFFPLVFYFNVHSCILLLLINSYVT